MEHVNAAHKLITQALPVFIYWNLWKNMCAIKYGGQQSNLSKVKFLIYKDISLLLLTVFPYISWPASWKKLITFVDKCTHEIKATPVYWAKPPLM